MLQNKHSLYTWAGGLKVGNAWPDLELVGLPSAEASVSAAPLRQRKDSPEQENFSWFNSYGRWYILLKGIYR